MECLHQAKDEGRRSDFDTHFRNVFLGTPHARIPGLRARGGGANPAATTVAQPCWAEMGVPDRGSMPSPARMYQAVVPVCSEAYT